eukprot:TRINITY_DN16376_c0_g1_i2.p1 TRINITY_DN16376_c0_g1~~TRINITY_DN16376_c0_g1_i2.p1  ORF type:complete len:1086 (-),score=275.43 TRINITY_DN16376_c0_g1_i2:89-3049(-)
MPSSHGGHRGPPPAPSSSRPSSYNPPPAPSSSGGASGGGGGSSSGSGGGQILSVSGGRNSTVSNIIKGEFEATSSNHNRPVYTKLTGTLTVLIYFWDDRDGPNFSGWWFGPKVGGDQVWAYNTSTSPVPPASNWRVPWDGPVDDSLRLSVRESGGSGGGSRRSSRSDPPPAPAPAPSSSRGGGGDRYRDDDDDRRRRDDRRGGRDDRRDQGDHRREADRREMERRELERRELERREAERREAERREAERREAERREAERREAERREAERRRREEEKRRWEEEQQRRREEEARRLAEEKRRREEQAKRERERNATDHVRKVIQKLRHVTPEDLEALRSDVERAQRQNYEAMGPHAGKVAQEAEKALETAELRVKDTLERRAREEQARQEQERKRKEEEALVEKLLEEATVEVTKAEERAAQAVDDSKGVAALLEQEKEKKRKAPADEQGEAGKGDEEEEAPAVPATPEEVIQAAIDAMGHVADARGTGESAAQFVAEKQKEMGDSSAARNARNRVRDLQDRLNDVRRSLARLAESLEATQEKAKRKSAALKRISKQEATFASINSCGGDALSRQDVAEFSKATYDFELPDDVCDKVMDMLAPITFGKFPRLKRALGIARLEAKERVRLAEEKARKQAEDERQAAAQKVADEASELLAVAEATVAKADAESRTLTRGGDSLSSDELRSASASIEAIVAQAKEEVVKAQEKVKEFEEECGTHEELKSVASRALPSLQQRCSSAEALMERSIGVAKDALEKAVQKAYAEVEGKRTEALTAIRERMKKESLDLEKLKAFLGELENVELPEGMADKLAKHLVSDFEVEALSKQNFADMMRLYYKCVKQTTISEELAIKSKTSRRLDVNEVLEALEPPTMDEVAKLQRVKCRALSDDVTGWVTIAGNQGTTFLATGGDVYDCVKETVVTDVLSVKDGTTVRKLAKGEAVRVLEFPKKDDSVGVKRIKGKAVLDGTVGWMTVCSNQGTIYLEPK